MIKKTWAIGEACKGGVISVEINRDSSVNIINRSWDYNKGSLKTSDQSEAPEISRRVYYPSKSRGWRFDAEEYLNNLTTYYFSDQIIIWILRNV